MSKSLRSGSAGVLLAALLAVPGLGAADAVKVDNDTFAGLEPRPIGPALTGGRIAAIDAVHEGEQFTIYVVVEHKNSALYRSDDGGESWQYLNNGSNLTVRPFYFGRIVAHPKDADKVYKPSLSLSFSEDGGKTFTLIGGSFHGDLHALW